MENLLWGKDLSDEDEDEVLQSIALQKSLISQSQSLMGGISCDSLQPGRRDTISTIVDTAVTAAEDTLTHYYNVLAANLEYDGYLAKLETNLKTLIAECKTNLDNLDRKRDDPIQKKRNQFFGPNNWAYRFGAPYFKDQNCYACPLNADTVSKMQQDEFFWNDLPSLRWWKPNQTEKLVEAIKNLSEEACKRDALIEKSALERECDTLEENSEERKRIEEKLQNFCIDDYISLHLEEKIATTDHDWMQLSVSVLKGRQSANECRAFWYNYLHPKFSKEKWTDNENSKLRSLAEDNDYQDWDLIAEQLGRRSGYQCFCQYKSETEQFCKRKWTKAEDEHLKAVVDKLRVGDYIPWVEVTRNIKDRSNIQVYNRWYYTLDPNIKKGRFTLQEDIIILRAVQKWGKNFTKIALYMPDRKVPQIRCRYVRTLSKKSAFLSWTAEEDDLLLQLPPKRQGQRRQWSKISERFPGKTSENLRHRYETLVQRQRTISTRPQRNVVISRKTASNKNIFTSYPEMWAFAEKLLSGDYPNSLTVSAPAPKGRPKPKQAASRSASQKKTSPIDEQLGEYFQATSYFMPSNQKFTSLPECDPVLIRDVAGFLGLLGAQLNIPLAGLDDDQSLEHKDRQILKGLCAAHPKVLASETAQLEVGDSVSLSEPEAEEPGHPVFGHLKYLCPPNISTLIGLRSFLLNKRKLVDSVTDVATDPILHDVDFESEAFRRATQLWEDRLLCLFALPNMLMKIEPQDSVSCNPGPSGLPPLRSAPLEDDAPGTADVFNVGRTQLLGDGSVVLSETRKKRNDGKASNPRPKKRAKKS